MAVSTTTDIGTTTDLFLVDTGGIVDSGGVTESMISAPFGVTETNGYFCVLYSDTVGTCAYYQASTTPLFVQDAGNVSFGIALILVLLFTMFVAFIFNSFGGSKKR